MASTARYPIIDGVETTLPVAPEYQSVLTPDAVAFVAKLARSFAPRRAELLQKRAARQITIDAGQLPDFLPETASIRAAKTLFSTLRGRR